MRTYYTTFHVGDGAWMTANAAEDMLVLAREGSQELRYRRSSGAAIVATMDVLRTFELSAAKYFRCVLGRVEGTRPGGPDADELRRITALGARTRAMETRRLQAMVLLAGDQHAEARRIWSRHDEDELAATESQVRAHPLASGGSPGAFFGCPERDGLF